MAVDGCNPLGHRWPRHTRLLMDPRRDSLKVAHLTKVAKVAKLCWGKYVILSHGTAPYMPTLPLWELPALCEVVDHHNTGPWTKVGILAVLDLYEHKLLVSFQGLRRHYNIPKGQFLTYNIQTAAIGAAWGLDYSEPTSATVITVAQYGQARGKTTLKQIAGTLQREPPCLE
ncbi:hypothetical protein NDU88_000894 [Pleurodeles waltl]|uniref:Uncharacterized protein n=1 Tax=Pleurodeles waltl TaxID=8319 RepID=A0AAV7WKS0_PLEWA|nr:hypothetical protein NDU88_000894 [Pleurodeles waltl]